MRSGCNFATYMTKINGCKLWIRNVNKHIMFNPLCKVTCSCTSFKREHGKTWHPGSSVASYCFFSKKHPAICFLWKTPQFLPNSTFNHSAEYSNTQKASAWIMEEASQQTTLVLETTRIFTTRMFPKIVGFPPQTIHRVFDYFHHPFGGVSPYFWREHPSKCLMVIG